MVIEHWNAPCDTEPWNTSDRYRESHTGDPTIPIPIPRHTNTRAGSQRQSWIQMQIGNNSNDNSWNLKCRCYVGTGHGHRSATVTATGIEIRDRRRRRGRGRGRGQRTERNGTGPHASYVTAIKITACCKQRRAGKLSMLWLLLLLLWLWANLLTVVLKHKDAKSNNSNNTSAWKYIRIPNRRQSQRSTKSASIKRHRQRRQACPYTHTLAHIVAHTISINHLLWRRWWRPQRSSLVGYPHRKTMKFPMKP